jgi:translocation and assembly module TamB
VSAAVHFDGAKLLIDKLDGEMGGAPFKMSGEALVFDPAPRLDLAFEGQSILLWRQPDVTVRADAHLTLKGPIHALVLAGDLALRDARYSRKFDFLSLPARARASAGRRGFQLFALQDPPFSTMALDLHVTSATPFVVANNVLHIELAPDLHLQGTGELPELRGTVNIEPSRVLLPSGTLRIRSGRIEFRPDQPDLPTLDIQATTHMQGYDVEVNVVGPYDNPRVDVSSVPPLAREDVVMLVLTGRPPSNNLTLATGERAAVDVAVYIARDVAAAWLSGEGEIGSEDSLAERIEVIVGAETTKTGVDSVLVRMRLAGKPGERGSGWYVTGERDVYDFYNYGLRFVFTFQ